MLVEPIGFSQLTLDVVTVYGTLEETFGHTDHNPYGMFLVGDEYRTDGPGGYRMISGTEQLFQGFLAAEPVLFL